MVTRRSPKPKTAVRFRVTLQGHVDFLVPVKAHVLSKTLTGQHNFRKATPMSWIVTGCVNADLITNDPTICILSGYTDETEMWREWGTADGVPVLRSRHWDDLTDRRRRCEHFVWTPA